jgi:hypothetical protein
VGPVGGRGHHDSLARCRPTSAVARQAAAAAPVAVGLARRGPVASPGSGHRRGAAGRWRRCSSPGPPTEIAHATVLSSSSAMVCWPGSGAGRGRGGGFAAVYGVLKVLEERVRCAGLLRGRAGRRSSPCRRRRPATGRQDPTTPTTPRAGGHRPGQPYGAALAWPEPSGGGRRLRGRVTSSSSRARWPGSIVGATTWSPSGRGRAGDAG